MNFKKPLAVIVLLSLTLGHPVLYAAASPPTQHVENLLSPEYGKLVLDDTWYVLSSPTRWNERDWIVAGLGVGSALAVGIWADKPIKEELQEHSGGANDDVAKAFEPFGREYSFAVLGAFELGGIAFHDDKSRAVAHDGLASSIIAGAITLSLQLATGRSRPRESDEPDHFSPFSNRRSFPSGHTTQAFAVASVIAEHYDSPLIKIGSYGTASMVGYARMERNGHWASDVLVGALIGTFVGRTVVHFNKDKRYELSPIVDGDMIGAKVTHTF